MRKLVNKEEGMEMEKKTEWELKSKKTNIKNFFA